MEIPKPLTQEVMEAYFDARPHLYPLVIGKSLMGNPLYTISLGAGEPRVLYVATHHAMEWICGHLLLHFADEYRKKSLENKAPLGTFYLVPLLNPDGVQLHASGLELFAQWQANARGVDLNHNYPAGFSAYKTIEQKLGIYGGAPTRYSGESPLSEPETAYLVSAIQTLGIQGVLTLHTQGREIYGGAKKTATILARRTGYVYTQPQGAAAYGGLTDYMNVIGVPCLTLECGIGKNPLPPTCFPSLLEETAPFLWKFPSLLKRYEQIVNL